MANSRPRDKYVSFLQGIKHAPLVGVDTETTGFRVKEMEDYLQGMSVSYKVGGMLFEEYIPLRHIDEENNVDREFFQELLHEISLRPTTWFNRKFDLHSIKTTGLNFPTGGLSYDALLLAQLLNENKPYAKTLENCAQLYIGKGKVEKDEIHSFGKLFGWDAIPSTVMAPYAKGDSTRTLELTEELLKLLRRKFGEDLDELWKWEQEMNTALFQMESTGIHVDLKFCRQYEAIAEIEMYEIEDDLGFTPSKSTELSKFLFDELGLPILERTPKGKPAMIKSVMEEYERMLAGNNDHRAQLVLNYRGWQKAVGTFYRPFQKLSDADGKIHANFKQHGTVTGRLSCSDPNLQQIPRTSDKDWNGRIRSGFRASPGFVLVGFDYSQLEFRLAAAYGEEHWLMEEFGKLDADVFTSLAERIGTDRYTAKTFTYAMIYGAGLEKIAATLGKTVEEIEAQYYAFQRTIPGIIKVKKQVEQKIRQRGYVRYWSGRRRNLWPDDAYKGFNSLLQGGGAEVVKRVLVQVNEEVCNDDCRLLLQVHDELLFEIREGMVEEYSPRIVKTMQDYPTNIFDVPFTVEGKVWGEAA